MILPEPLKSEVENYIKRDFDNKKAGMVGYIGGLPTVGAQDRGLPGLGNVLVQLRRAAEEAGADIRWNEAAREVIIEYRGHRLQFRVGEMAAWMDGRQVDLPHPPELRDGRMMVPQRILEQFLAR
ncbi:protein of unknown function [Kyrpidia spormannii]|uniref:Copper amine oxidase-like N-terminal domain-containing protein n=2 Tax=Kyrpidia spormannii TaxID=2055160 RepID=A0A6F9EC54_9BACL|nr:protein of unknown function [Kyrpidia spormannii]